MWPIPFFNFTVHCGCNYCCCGYSFPVSRGFLAKVYMNKTKPEVVLVKAGVFLIR